MGSARRLYLYAASLVGLGLLAVGVQQLLSLVIQFILDALGTRVIGGAPLRQDVSLALSLVIVGAPIWAGHWLVIGRGMRGLTPPALEQRQSAIRSLHFAVVQFVAFVAAMTAALDIGREALHAALVPGDGGYLGWVAGSVSTLVVAGAVWVYHASVRGRDLRVTPLHGAAAWLPRLYRYAVLLISLGLVLGSASLLIVAVLDQLIRPSIGNSLAALVADTVPGILIGMAAWLVHWRGEDERVTRLRAGYFGIVWLGSIIAGVTAAVASFTSLLALVLGTGASLDPIEALRDVAGPPLYALPLVLAGWLHFRHRLAEMAPAGAGVDDVRRAELPVRRICVYLLALVGLAVLAGGTFTTLNLVLHSIVDGPALIPRSLADELASPIAALAVGLFGWMIAWRWILARRAAEPEVETRSAPSRIYLYLIVGVALFAAMPAAALIVYRLLDTLLGGATRDLAEALATPFATVVVAGLIGVYHGLVLRTDREMAAPLPELAPAHAPAALAAPARAVDLLLHLPQGSDLEVALSAMRGVLPPGALLEAAREG